jgi:hypothetical protein
VGAPFPPVSDNTPLLTTEANNQSLPGSRQHYPFTPRAPVSYAALVICSVLMVHLFRCRAELSHGPVWQASTARPTRCSLSKPLGGELLRPAYHRSRSRVELPRGRRANWRCSRLVQRCRACVVPHPVRSGTSDGFLFEHPLNGAEPGGGCSSSESAY